MQSLSVIKGFQKTGLPWFPLSPTVLMFLFLLSRRPSDMIDYIPFTNCALVEVMKKSELIIIMPRWHIWPVMQICHHFSCFISQYEAISHVQSLTLAILLSYLFRLIIVYGSTSMTLIILYLNLFSNPISKYDHNHPFIYSFHIPQEATKHFQIIQTCRWKLFTETL